MKLNYMDKGIWRLKEKSGFQAGSFTVKREDPHNLIKCSFLFKLATELHWAPISRKQ